MTKLMLTLVRSNFSLLRCKTLIDRFFVCTFRLIPKQANSPCDAQSSVTGLKLQLGTQAVECSAYVTGELRSHGRVSMLTQENNSQHTFKSCVIYPESSESSGIKPKARVHLSFSKFPFIALIILVFLCLPSEDETSELCLGLQTLLELKVRFLQDFLLLLCLIGLFCYMPARFLKKSSQDWRKDPGKKTFHEERRRHKSIPWEWYRVKGWTDLFW